jgi:aconitate hydratase
VDHNLLQADERNIADHLFLRSACQRFGLWYSKPGNGVSHPVHMQRFGVPGASLVGSDSHTCAAGSLGMRRSAWAGWRRHWPSRASRST